MQFARDAHQAEGWLLTQEPYLKKNEEKNAVCNVFFFDIIRMISIGARGEGSSKVEHILML